MPVRLEELLQASPSPFERIDLFGITIPDWKSVHEECWNRCVQYISHGIPSDPNYGAKLNDWIKNLWFDTDGQALRLGELVMGDYGQMSLGEYTGPVAGQDFVCFYVVYLDAMLRHAYNERPRLSGMAYRKSRSRSKSAPEPEPETSDEANSDEEVGGGGGAGGGAGGEGVGGQHVINIENITMQQNVLQFTQNVAANGNVIPNPAPPVPPREVRARITAFLTSGHAISFYIGFGTSLLFVFAGYIIRTYAAPRVPADLSSIAVSLRSLSTTSLQILRDMIRRHLRRPLTADQINRILTAVHASFNYLVETITTILQEP